MSGLTARTPRDHITPVPGTAAAVSAAVRYLILAIVLTGCWPEEDVLLFDERFEGELEARWQVSGAVGIIETAALPGEHGLVFYDVTTMTTPLSVTVYDQYSDGLWLEYTSTCGGSPLVSLAREGSAYRIWLDLPVAQSDWRPSGEFERVRLSLPPFPTDPWGSGPDFSIFDLTVATAGTPHVACMIDNLRLYQPAVEYGF